MDSDALAQIDWMARSGFYDHDTILEIVTEQMFEPGEVDADAASAAIRERLLAKRVAEASWPDETDCDRLDAAFATLNAAGIVALQNAGYTLSDGIDDVSEVYAELGGADSGIVGYCFYHSQDLERATNGAGLMLAFGDIRGDDEKGIEVGRAIVVVMKSCGFDVSWSESLKERIGLPDLDWKRRGESPPADPRLV
jgi:hypothetical protein